MKRRYIIGIFIAIGILVLNQVFIQYWLAQKKYDAKTINLAGKQRMLSQRINLGFYMNSYDEVDQDSMADWIEQLSVTHHDLLQGEMGLNPIVHEEAKAIMLQLTKRIEFVKSQFNQPGPPDPETLKQITANQTAFLHNMDQVVDILESESYRKLRFIVWIEILLVLVSLIIITLEVIFIYMPIEKRLSKSLKRTKHINSRLQDSLVHLEQKNKELEQFVFIASHDLQEPLRTISSFSSLLEKQIEGKSDERTQKSLHFLRGAAKRMSELIRGLLDYAQLGVNSEKDQLNLNQLLEDVKADLAISISESKAQFQVEPLPLVMGYPTEIRLLFQNLISNAIKYRKQESAPHIEIAAEPVNGHWKFKIKDNGIGISETFKEKIFIIFQRLHHQKEYSGTGIGLAHCRKIVNLHGGNIWVESEPGEGSTFFFTIKKH